MCMPSCMHSSVEARTIQSHRLNREKMFFINLLSIDCCPPVFWVGALFKKEYLILLTGQIDLLSSKHSKNDAELSGNILKYFETA